MADHIPEISPIDGYKTYIVATLTVIYAIAGWYLDFHTADRAVDLVIASGFAGTFRSALKNIQVRW